MNPNGNRTALLAIVLILALMASGQAMALTDEEVFRSFQFNFINPGGRALGLGGAFIAAADDATAAEANPAALHYINRIELFGEYRFSDVTSSEFDNAQTVGDNTLGSLDLPYLDLGASTDVDNANVPSFLSVAYPFKLGSARATIAGSRQVVLDTKSTLKDNSLDFAFIPLPWINPDAMGGPAVEQYTINNSSVGSLDTQLVNYNVAFSISAGDLSFGATATMASLDMRSSLSSRASDPLGLLSTVNPRVDIDGNNLLDDVLKTSNINDSDTAFGYTFGIHYHPDSLFDGFSPVRFGAVYRKGADLSVSQTSTIDPGSTPTAATFNTTLRVPDRYGIGVSGELGQRWLFALDLERIEYSDLLEGFRAGENFFTGGLIDNAQIGQTGPPVYDVDDATVVHMGAEYTVITDGNWNFGFRGGFYNAPDNRIRMTEFPTTDPDIEALYLDAFRGGEDETHFTGGFSFTAPSGIQVQLAADVSDLVDQVIVSAIWRTGRLRR